MAVNGDFIQGYGAGKAAGMSQQIAETTTAWLEENIDPDSGYAIDKSLTVENAAADAKATGSAIGNLKSAIDLYSSDNHSNVLKKNIATITPTMTKGKGVLRWDLTGAGVKGDVVDTKYNTYACTDLLKIPLGAERIVTNVKTQSTMNYGWCIYDSSMNVIESGYAGAINLAGYDSAIFIRLTCYNSSETFSDLKILFLNTNSVQSAYLEGHIFSKISGIGMNVFNKDTLMENFLIETDGAINYNTSYSSVIIKKETSDFIRLRSSSIVYRYVLFDSGFNALSFGTNKYAFNVSTATYIGLDFANTTDFNSLMLIFTNENSANDSNNIISGYDYIPYGRNIFDKNVEGVVKSVIAFRDVINTLIRQEQKTYSITTNNQGEKQITFTGGSSNITQMVMTYPCDPMKIVSLEYNAMSSEPEVDYTHLKGAILYIVFLDKNGNQIGNKFNSGVCGATRCGYHRTQYVSPIGTKSLKLTIVTRKNTNASFTNLTVSILDAIPPRIAGAILDGHLGATNVAPQNTLPAFELLSKEGFKTCVVNVNRTQDNELVALHNDTIDSTSDGTGNVYDFTFSQLQEFDFGSWFNAVYTGTKIPSIDQVAMLFASNGLIPIFRLQGDWNTTDMDATLLQTLLEKLYEIIKKYNFEGKAVIKAFSMDVLQDAYDVIGNDATYIWCANLTAVNIGLCASFDGDITLEPEGSSITAEWVENAKNAGVKLSAYTISDPIELKHLISLGINRFCTDGGANVAFPAD